MKKKEKKLRHQQCIKARAEKAKIEAARPLEEKVVMYNRLVFAELIAKVKAAVAAQAQAQAEAVLSSKALLFTVFSEAARKGAERVEEMEKSEVSWLFVIVKDAGEGVITSSLRSS